MGRRRADKPTRDTAAIDWHTGDTHALFHSLSRTPTLEKRKHRRKLTVEAHSVGRREREEKSNKVTTASPS